MSATDLAAIVIVLLAIAGIIIMLSMWQLIRQTMTHVEETMERFVDDAEPLIAELREASERTVVDLAKAEQLLDTAQAITGTADSASKLAYLAVANPVIKTVALASGTAEAARRIRKGA